MEQTFAYAAWFFTRALCLIYLVAFLSLLPQARGLWGKQGVMPMAPYMKTIEGAVDAHRFWKVPSVFWLSTSDDFMVGTAVTGAVAAGLALIGFAQGPSLLFCYVLYLSFCSSGQDFMSFQWDALLCEVGVLALFCVPWNFDFSLARAEEPHWLVRGMFYVILFKLMFLSGFVKLWSGDDSWRDFSALDYHYFTQPLPTPLAPFAHALPSGVHSIMVGLTYLVELVLPFFLFWPRARAYTAIGFVGLSAMIALTGNYTFFNYLTIVLCFWLIPDSFWQRLIEFVPFKVEAVPAMMFPHPLIASAMGILAAVSAVYCLYFILPDFALEPLQPVLRLFQTYRISNSYGLFAVMTKQRPEIIIEGSNDGQDWKEYEFKYKPGSVYRPPPWIAPLQPRLDWQMWFAALGPADHTPWFGVLMARLTEGSPKVLEFFSKNPFPEAPPKQVRAKLYNYEFTTPEEILNNEIWWKRTPTPNLYWPPK